MHTEHSLEHRDPSFDDAVASGHEWRLFLLRQCSQIVGLLSRDWNARYEEHRFMVVANLPNR